MRLTEATLHLFAQTSPLRWRGLLFLLSPNLICDTIAQMIKHVLTATDGLARAGRLQTPHGDVQTPAFMAVATHGAVKGVDWDALRDLGAEIVLSNTYHLYLRPGAAAIKAAGGIHQFLGWSGPILTDSGGFQVFSLGHKRGGKLAKIDDDGVTFYSHLDGSEHRLTPQSVWELQSGYGVDIAMPLDECPPTTAEPKIVERAMHRTHSWLKQQADLWRQSGGETALFGIIQGGLNMDWREQSLAAVTANDLAGYALGGLAVGESKAEQYNIVRRMAPQMPDDRPRYLMGVGDPYDMLWAIEQGIDMFDCVLPTRLARHGAIWIVEGNPELVERFWSGSLADFMDTPGQLDIVRRTAPNADWAKQAGPVQPNGPAETSLRRDLANHLAKEKEIDLLVRFSKHNLRLIYRLLELAREAIAAGRYVEYADRFNRQLAEPGDLLTK